MFYKLLILENCHLYTLLFCLCLAFNIFVFNSSSQNVLPTISTPEIPQSNMMNSSGMGMNQRSPNPRQPPPNYLCYICRIPGHFINDCPQKQQGGGRNKQQKPPPANYVCHKCQVGGM